VAVGRQLHTVGEAIAKIVHESQCIFAVATTDKPGNDQLGIAIKRCPGPSVASLFRGVFRLGHVLGFGVGEAPNFVTLHLGSGDASHVLVMEGSASLAGVDQRLADRVDRYIIVEI